MTTSIQLRSETTKIRTTRLWWVFALGLTFFAAASSGLLAVAVSIAPAARLDLGTAESAAVIYNLSIALAYVIPFVFGVLLVTADLHHGTLALSVIGEPRRSRIFVAKCIAAVIICFGYGVFSMLGGVAGGSTLLLLNGLDTHVLSPETVSRLVGGSISFALWGLIGVGLGALVKNQLVAIIAVIAFTQFLEPMIRFVTLGSSMSLFLPGAVSDAAAGGSLITLATGGESLSQQAAIAVLFLYALVLAAFGAVRFNRYQFT